MLIISVILVLLEKLYSDVGAIGCCPAQIYIFLSDAVLHKFKIFVGCCHA